MLLDPKDFTADNYSKNLQNKIAYIENLFADFAAPELEVFTSPEKHYRQRAEFKVWHQGEDIYHAMFDVSNAKPQHVRVNVFPTAAECINKIMAKIMPQLAPNEILRHKLFQIEYLSNLDGDILVSLVYHKKLDQNWQIQAEQLAEQLNIDIIGRSRKQKIVIGQDFIIEKMCVNNRQIQLMQIENSFTQPNAVVAEKMLNWAATQTEKFSAELKKRDLLELYSGNSFFSLALTDNFRKILGAEVSKASTKAANYNIEVNACSNVKAINAKAEDIAELLKNPQATKNALAFSAGENLNLADWDFASVLVDPPRKGLDKQTLEEVQKFEKIIYISCNPESLKQNLLELQTNFEISAFAFFDQFPYTHHAELGMVLSKKHQ